MGAHSCALSQWPWQACRGVPRLKGTALNPLRLSSLQSCLACTFFNHDNNFSTMSTGIVSTQAPPEGTGTALSVKNGLLGHMNVLEAIFKPVDASEAQEEHQGEAGNAGIEEAAVRSSQPLSPRPTRNMNKTNRFSTFLRVWASRPGPLGA